MGFLIYFYVFHEDSRGYLMMLEEHLFVIIPRPSIDSAFILFFLVLDVLFSFAWYISN